MTTEELKNWIGEKFDSLVARIDCLERKMFQENGVQQKIAVMRTEFDICKADCRAERSSRGKKAWDFAKLIIAAGLAIGGAKYL